MSGVLEAASVHMRDQRLSLMSACVCVISHRFSWGLWKGKWASVSSLVFWLSEESKVTLGLCCFPLWALGWGSVCLPGVFERTADGGGDSDDCFCWCLHGDGQVLAVHSLQLFMLQAAHLSSGRPGTQRPLLVSFAERVGAELTEGFGVFPADVAVMPGTIPAACRGVAAIWSQIKN